MARTINPRAARGRVRAYRPRSPAAAWSSSSRSAVGAHDPVPAQHPASTGYNPLLEALQLWRRERAKQDAVPAYVVAHDATLVAIAEDKPQSISQLRRVKGMGPVKLDSYGEDIIAIVSSHSRN